MTGFQYFAGSAFILCLISLSFHLFRLIRLGPPKDFSKSKGDVGKAIGYSFTGGMNPMKKESAYLHLPTYLAGLMYHAGTFVALLFFVIKSILDITLPFWLQMAIVSLLILSASSGLGIFFKRLTVKKLSSLSNPDDYISNLFVTVFQVVTFIFLVDQSFAPYYLVWAGLLFLYIPVGKLKHLLYFFSARIHLGFFYGWRGTWPPQKEGTGLHG